MAMTYQSVNQKSLTAEANTAYLFDPTASLTRFALGGANGNTVAINMVSSDFKASVSGRTLKLVATDGSGVVVQMIMPKSGAASNMVTFLDGEVQVSYSAKAGKTPASMTFGDVKLSNKAVDLGSEKAPAYSINESKTYFTVESDAGGNSQATGGRELTAGDDMYTGTSGKDVFNAASLTLGTNDIIVDKTAGDNDVMNITLTSDDNAGTPTIKGIENVNITFAMGTATFDADNMAGATITAKGGSAGFDGLVTLSNLGANNLVAGAGVTEVDVDGIDGGTINLGAADTATLAADNGAISVTVNGDASIEATGGANVLNVLATKDSTIVLAAASDVQARVAGSGTGKVTVFAEDVSDLHQATVTGVAKVIGAGDSKTVDIGKWATGAEVVVAGDGQEYDNVNGQTFTVMAADAATTFSGKYGTSTVNVQVQANGADLDFIAGTNVIASETISVDAGVGTMGDVDYSNLTLTLAGDLEATTFDENAATNKLTIKGSGDLDVTGASVVSNVDASALAGGLTLESSVTANKVVMKGGTGNDDLTAGNTDKDAVITTGAGNDSVTFDAIITAAKLSVDTGEGNDKIDVEDTSGLNGITMDFKTGAGNDTVKLGSATADDTGATDSITIEFGDGVDTLVLGGADYDTAKVLAFNNLESIVLGGNVTLGAATLSGKTYAISGAAGNETLDVNALAGTRAINLGGLVVDGTVASVTVDASAATASVTVTGSAVAEDITASDNGDTINAGAGNDTVTGGTGGDAIYGEAGNDDLTAGGTVASLVDGGSGNDTIVGAADGDTLVGGSGNDTITTTGTKDVVIDGGDGVDDITGSAGKDTITGGAGNDTIDGNGGDDKIDGGDGDDDITGGSGDETLAGGAGNDTIEAGGGDDVINGGAGDDTIDLDTNGAATDKVTVTGGTGADTITLLNAHTEVNKLVFAAGDSTIAATDEVENFVTQQDILDLASAKIAGKTVAEGTAYGSIKSHSITDGVITFDDAADFVAAVTVTATNLADVLGYLKANIKNDAAVAFDFDGTDTYVFQGTSTETVIKLVGVTGITEIADLNIV